MACVERSELVRPPPSSSGQREEASPRLAAKQGHGEAPLPPTLLGPYLAGQAPGRWGSCGSGQSLLARLPHPQGKAGLSPWGTPPADRHRTVPASPDQSGHRTLQFAWKGSESAALVCPPHFTPFPDDHCLAQPQGPGAPGPDLSLSFRPLSWCPCPCLVPSGGLTRCWPRVGLGLRDSVGPTSCPPRGFSPSQGCPWF